MPAAYLSNAHTRIVATGLAIDERAATAYYAGAAGPGTSCKSIWASLVSNGRAACSSRLWTGSINFAFKGKGVKTIWSSIPDTTYKHFVSVTPQENVILLIEPQAAIYYSSWQDRTHRQARADLLQTRIGEAVQRLYLWVKANADAPVLPEWKDQLWEEAERTRGTLTKLGAYGDCLAAWLIDPEADWRGIVRTMLRNHSVEF